MHKTLEAYFGKNEFTAKKGLDPFFAIGVDIKMMRQKFKL